MNQQPSRALCLWPGLAGLWLRGQWGSLGLAVSFSLLLNLALAGSFVWPDLPGPHFSLVAWPLLAVAWLVSLGISWKSLDRMADPRQFAGAGDDTLFIQAQTEYLKGDWELCEQLLVRRLTDHPRDLASRLLLATTLRRAGRRDTARQHLDTIQKIDGWQIWQAEIHRERGLLDTAGSIDETGESDSRETDLTIAVVDGDAGDAGDRGREQAETNSGFVRLGEGLERADTKPLVEKSDHNPDESQTRKAA